MLQLGFSYRFNVARWPTTQEDMGVAAPEFVASSKDRADFLRRWYAFKPTVKRRAYRVTGALERHGDHVLRSESDERAPGPVTVRIYYKSAGDADHPSEWVYIETQRSHAAGSALCREYWHNPAVDTQCFSTSNPHTVLHGARLVTLPSQMVGPRVQLVSGDPALYGNTADTCDESADTWISLPRAA